MRDLLIYETGDGGDLKVLNNDLALTTSLYNQVYLCLFGGNVEASTKGNELENEKRFDWWANDLLDLNFNSETERIINTVTLNPSGRLKILQAVKNDLKPIDLVANYTVEVILENVNRFKILINLTEKLNKQEKIIQILWDISKDEVILSEII
mgnify:CR=1 FL=1